MITMAYDFVVTSTIRLVKVKVRPLAEAHRAALISVSVALSQTSDKAARPQTRG